MMASDQIDYPEEFRSAYIKCLPDLNTDLRKILETSGDRVAYGVFAVERYRFLEAQKNRCVFHKKWFESYGKYKGLTLFAIRFANTRHNIRIVFIFRNDKALLLHAFMERGNDDIERAKEIAYRRFCK